ncbi:MAG: hypothetical protein KDB53_15250 [Planctomycetes bacterium]|nr:hypothetical protein [Planctomycetota bacterium]
MTLKSSCVVLAVMLTLGFAPAQTNHTVHADGITFVDQNSFSPTTIITIGDSVTWIFVSGGAHTVTSGTGFSDPNLGALFDSPLDFSTPVFSYTPLATGVIDYVCQPHLLCCGMTGQIIVLPPPTYPGSGDDLSQTSSIGPTPSFDPLDVKSAVAGSLLRIKVTSPNGTLDTFPLLMGAQLMMQGGPAPIGVLPNLYINSSGGVILVDPYSSGVLGMSQVVLPGGSLYGFLLPNGLTGFSIMIQTLVIAPGVANPPGVARSSGLEIQMI